MIVVGELPLINLALTDKKLFHVLKILTNLNHNNFLCKNAEKILYAFQ